MPAGRSAAEEKREDAVRLVGLANELPATEDDGRVSARV
jgi:hypothetical protein